MGLSDIGNLVCLPFDEIEPGPQTTAHDFIIQEASNLLRKTKRNWMPIIVKEISVDRYQVVANAFVYEAIAESGLEEAWCIMVNDDDDTAEVSAVLAHDRAPRVNLSKASHKQIKSALDYLKKQPDTKLKGVDLAKATGRIESAPRKYWETLKPITKLGCGISAKKIKELKDVFYLEPEPWPEVITDPTLLESFTADELKKMAAKRGIEGRSKLKRKSDLVKRLSEPD